MRDKKSIREIFSYKTDNVFYPTGHQRGEIPGYFTVKVPAVSVLKGYPRGDRIVSKLHS
jgi:hypothetical protein